MLEDLNRKIISKKLFEIIDLVEHNKSLLEFIKTLENINYKFSSDFQNIYTVVEGSMYACNCYIYGDRYETDDEYKERIRNILKNLEFKDKIILQKLVFNEIGNL